MKEHEIERFNPTSQQEWRDWLEAHHQTKESVCLVMNKKGSGKPFMAWEEAVDHALCFGWIDGKRQPLDESRFLQFYSRRRPRGTWSKVNKAKIAQLIERGLMTKAGLEVIEKAKQNGSWTILDDVEELTIPDDLEKGFAGYPGSKDYFLGLSKSVRKMMLAWLSMAKRQDTRQKRLAELMEHLAHNERPPRFR